MLAIFLLLISNNSLISTIYLNYCIATREHIFCNISKYLSEFFCCLKFHRIRHNFASLKVTMDYTNGTGAKQYNIIRRTKTMVVEKQAQNCPGLLWSGKNYVTLMTTNYQAGA